MYTIISVLTFGIFMGWASSSLDIVDFTLLFTVFILFILSIAIIKKPYIGVYSLIAMSPLVIYRYPLFQAFNLSAQRLFLVLSVISLALILLNKRCTIQLYIKGMAVLKAQILTFLVFILLNLMMTLYSLNVSYAIRGVFTLIAGGIVMALIVMVVSNRERLNTAIKVFIWSSILPLTIAFYQLYSWLAGKPVRLPLIVYLPLLHENSILHIPIGWEYRLEIPRLTGTFAEPNIFAMYLVGVLLFLICLIMSNIRKNRKIGLYLIILGVANFSVLLMTFSRSGWFSLLIGLIPILLYNVDLAFKPKVFLMLFTLLLITISLAFILAPDTVFSENVLLQRLEFRDMSLEGHIKTRLEGLQIFAKSPIIGAGLQSYGILTGQPEGVSSTHSPYFTYLAEGGLLGILFLLVWIGSIGKGIWTTFVKYGYKNKSRDFYYILAALSSFIALLFNNILYHTLFADNSWVLLGLILSIVAICGKNHEKGE